MDRIVLDANAEQIMNAIELLKQQHREVDDLFKQFEKARRGNEKEKIFLEIAARLVGHDAIEREIFYPACEEVLGEDERLMEGIAEHGLMEFSIFRADKARHEPTFDYLVTVLKEMVEHHVEEEEQDVLPRVSKKLDADDLKRLGELMEARFEQSMQKDFRRPLKQNLERVLAGRVRALPTKRPKRATTARKRSASARPRRRRATPSARRT
jgi:hemerythrin superfamily protein